ncbi:MAG: hypothetical protein K5787_02345 [Lentisphaeria bacterium]|nr:hypothetical protein [Lentisphaeria bacterium]
MADKDLSLKDFLADTLVFADVINLAFRRQHFVVDPKMLRGWIPSRLWRRLSSSRCPVGEAA